MVSRWGAKQGEVQEKEEQAATQQPTTATPMQQSLSQPPASDVHTRSLVYAALLGTTADAPEAINTLLVQINDDRAAMV